MTTIKNENDFWRKKLDMYTQIIEDETLICYAEIPKSTNWSLNKRLSKDIKASVIFLDNENGKSYNFQFSGNHNFMYHYMDTAEHVISLYNLIIENFENDNAELQKLLTPIKEREAKFAIEQDNIVTSVKRLMKNSDYKWKMKKNILQIKLKCNRILEIKLSNKSLNHFQKENDDKNFIEIIASLDTQLSRIPFLVNIDNSIRNW